MSSKIILITGANRGIGFGIVQGLAQRSSEDIIILAARKKKDAEQAIVEAQNRGFQNRFFPLALDVTLDDSIQATGREIISEFGRLDVLINNAGIGLHEDGTDLPSMRQAWTATFNTNLTSIRLLTHALLPLLHLSPSPRVINISSARGSFARAGNPSAPPTASLPYSVSKAALNMLTLEMGKLEGRVAFYAVSPGHCRTGFNGFRGTREPVEGGRCAVELACAGEGVYLSGFWECEGGEMRAVEW